MESYGIALGVITFGAAIVNGALGYGFSSITVPLALLFLSNRVLNPALVPIARAVTDGHQVPVGDCVLEVIAIQGHTPGSIALLYDDPSGHPHLFTGDSLFPGGVGNTIGDATAFQQLIDDVETKIFGRLPDDTWFYPGHGNDSTLGVERPHLAEWRARGW